MFTTQLSDLLTSWVLDFEGDEFWHLQHDLKHKLRQKTIKGIITAATNEPTVEIITSWEQDIVKIWKNIKIKNSCRMRAHQEKPSTGAAGNINRLLFLAAKLSQDTWCWRKIAIVFIYGKYKVSSGKTVTKIW